MGIEYLVVLGIGTVLAIIYVILLLATGKKYDYLIEPLDSKEYRLKELYTFGFLIKDITKHKFTSKGELKRRKYIAVLKGEKYAEYYLYVEYAKRIGLAAPLLIVSFMMAGMAREILICPILIVITVAVYLYIGFSVPLRFFCKDGRSGGFVRCFSGRFGCKQTYS